MLWLLLFLSSPSQAGVWNACSMAFRGLPAEQNWAKEDVEIISFPGAHHTKLRVGDKVYANTSAICEKGNCELISSEALDRLAKNKLSKGVQVRYSVRVSEPELQELKKYLAEGKFADGITCTHSVCRSLSKTTGLVVPLPANVFPILNTLYLTMARAYPRGRIREIRMIFPKEAGQTQLGAAAYNGLMEVAVIGLSGVAVWSGKALVEAELADEARREKLQEEAYGKKALLPHPSTQK